MESPMKDVENAEAVMGNGDLNVDQQHARATALALIAIAKVLVDWSAWGPTMIAVETNPV